MTAPSPVEDRFWQFVVPGPPDECWLWLGSRTRLGYGQISERDRPRRAYRVSYEMHHGPIPAGMLVRHLCNNPPCVNPAHLRIGTVAENMQDMVEAGNSTRKLTAGQAAEIRRLGAEGKSLRQIGRLFECSRSTVARILHGETYQ